MTTRVIRIMIEAIMVTVISTAYSDRAQSDPPEASKSASGTKSAAAITEEVRALLKQLDQMPDATRRSTAEQLTLTVLSELEYRPDIERIRGRRSSLQLLRDGLANDLTATEKQLDGQRSRLAIQLKDIEAQSKGNAQLCQRRTNTVIQSSAPAVRKAIAHRNELSRQLKELDARIDRCTTSEQVLVDSLSLALETGIPTPMTISLPRELPFQKSKPAADEDSSASDKLTPEANQRLLVELGINLK